MSEEPTRDAGCQGSCAKPEQEVGGLGEADTLVDGLDQNQGPGIAGRADCCRRGAVKREGMELTKMECDLVVELLVNKAEGGLKAKGVNDCDKSEKSQ